MSSIALFNVRPYGYEDADAILIEGNRIAKIGLADDLKALADRIEDAEGAYAYPGFHDSHLHLHMTGQALSCASLGGCGNMDELIEALRSQKGPFVHGMGWNQETLAEKRMPTADDLDKVCTDRPVVAERSCTHILSANHKAMEMTGLFNETGIFSEDDCTPFLNLLKEDDETLIEAAVDHCLQLGLTCVEPADLKEYSYRRLLPIYKKMSERIRIHHQVNITDLQQMKDFLEYFSQYETPTNTLGPFKGFADGALGGRTAWMKEDYADDPGNRGEAVMSLKEMKEFVAACASLGRPAVFHSIGDGAMDAVLKAFEASQDENNSLHFGILHVQITDQDILERMKKQKIIAYIQPIFWKADAPVVESRVGKEKASTSYAFGTLFEQGLAPLGTDCPIEDCDPMENIYYALHCDNPLTLEQAIEGYTSVPAAAMNRQDDLGRLEEGYLADLSFFDRPVDGEQNAKAVNTMVDGKLTHSF